jgi:hypothetical protein
MLNILMDENVEVLLIICGGALVVSLLAALLLSKRIRSHGLIGALKARLIGQRSPFRH